MKVIREKLENYPDNILPIATAVEGQALEDEEVFDKRWAEAEKDAYKKIKLPVDGAPKAKKPSPVEYPKVAVTEAYYDNPSARLYSSMLIDLIDNNTVDAKEVASNLIDWLSDSDIEEFLHRYHLIDNDEFNESFKLSEDLNEMHTGKVVQSVVKNKFGIDVDVQTYKDSDLSNSIIVQFILSKNDNDKLIYDELKEELYKKFKDRVNISVKTFSSPNLEEKRVEYKIKVFVIKERKNKYGATNAHKKSFNYKTESLHLTEDTDRSQAEIYIMLPLSIILASGAELDANMKVKEKREILLQFLVDRFGFNPDDIIRLERKGLDEDYEWELIAQGSDDLINKFHSRFGGEVNHVMSAEKFRELGLTDKEDPDLATLIWNELDTNYAESLDKWRRIPSQIGYKKNERANQDVWPNPSRYKSIDSKDRYSEIELEQIEENGHLAYKITPKRTIRTSGLPNDLTFARKVADTYSDFSEYFDYIEAPDGSYAEFIFDDDYPNIDIYSAMDAYKDKVKKSLMK